MEDIVPELYKKIKSEFDSFIKKDIEIQEILKGENKEASFEDVSFLSGRIGRYAAKCLLKYINKETMPDGKLYWNVLSRTVIPIVKEAHKLINDLAITVQLIQDNKQNIGISPIRTKFNQERIESIINKLMVIQDEVIENEQG